MGSLAHPLPAPANAIITGDIANYFLTPVMLGNVSGTVALPDQCATAVLKATGPASLKPPPPAFVGQVLTVVITGGGANVTPLADTYPKGKPLPGDQDIVTYIAAGDNTWWCFGTGDITTASTAGTSTGSTSTGTSSSGTTTSTGATTSTGTLVGSIDFTTASSTTGLTLSPSGAAVTAGANVTVISGSGLGVVSTGAAVSDNIKAAAPLTRERVTADYVMTVGPDSNNSVLIGVGANAGLDAILCFKIASNGDISNQFNGNYHGTFTPASNVVVPMAGTAVYEWDQSKLTATLKINGTLAATWVGDTTGGGNWGTKCGGAIISPMAWNSGKTSIKNLKIEAF